MCRERRTEWEFPVRKFTEAGVVYDLGLRVHGLYLRVLLTGGALVRLRQALAA
jgi:hypothetical protein